MHQTTIRFGSDLWESLAVAASAEGVSVAQYVRESAVERLVRAGDLDDREPVASTDRRRDARSPRVTPRGAAGPFAPPSPVPELDRRAVLAARAADGQRAAARNTESSAAVWAQSRLARARARELRAASRALAAERATGRATGALRRDAPSDPTPGEGAPRVAGSRA